MAEGDDMTEKLCGNCKFLGDRLTEYDDDREEVSTQYFKCDLIAHVGRNHMSASTRKALVQDASGYYAALCVREEFGCVQWAPRESK